jgi:hypothetical protein
VLRHLSVEKNLRYDFKLLEQAMKHSDVFCVLHLASLKDSSDMDARVYVLLSFP